MSNLIGLFLSVSFGSPFFLRPTRGEEVIPNLRSGMIKEKYQDIIRLLPLRASLPLRQLDAAGLRVPITILLSL